MGFGLRGECSEGRSCGLCVCECVCACARVLEGQTLFIAGGALVLCVLLLACSGVCVCASVCALWHTYDCNVVQCSRARMRVRARLLVRASFASARLVERALVRCVTGWGWACVGRVLQVCSCGCADLACVCVCVPTHALGCALW